MKSKIVGQLIANQYDNDFYESEPFEINYFDKKKLKIGFIDAKDEEYINSADFILENFLKLDYSDRLKDYKLVYDYYLQALNYGYSKSLELNTPDSIWNFVTPLDIIIHWDEKGDFYLCVSCDCDWELEHGLQLVFKDGIKLIRASGNDGHFED